MTTTSQLESRVRALLRPGVRRARPRGPARIGVATLALSLGLACATGRPAARVKDSAPEPAVHRSGTILLALMEDGRVFHAGREIGVGGVTPLVERQCAQGALPVIIQCAPDAPAWLLVRVSDDARAGGAERVAFETPVDAAASLRRVSGRSTADAVPIASLDAQPKALDQPAPKLTAELRAHLPATVWVQFVVNEQGHVAAAEAQESTDGRFHQAAIEAVARWRFEPGTRDGETVPFRMRVPVSFFGAIEDEKR